MDTITSFLFGLTLAISIGPIALLIINRSLNCGLRTGVFTGLAAAVADFTYAAISFSAGSAISAFLIHYQSVLHAMASIILILLGIRMLYNALKKSGKSITIITATCKKPFFPTYLLTVMNPLTIVAFTSFAAQTSIKGFTAIFICSLALFTGSLLIQLSLAIFGSALKKYVSSLTAILLLNIISSSLIVCLGIFKLL